MRYIIIPLAIILYLIWSYKVIKKLIEYKLKIKKYIEDTNNPLELITFAFWLDIIFVSIVFLCIKYW